MNKLVLLVALACIAAAMAAPANDEDERMDMQQSEDMAEAHSVEKRSPQFGFRGGFGRGFGGGFGGYRGGFGHGFGGYRGGFGGGFGGYRGGFGHRGFFG